MVMTVMSVATPIVSPSIVSEARSLCARKALKHCTRLSRAASIGLEKTPTHFTDSFARAPPARGRHGSRHYVNTKKGERELPSRVLDSLGFSKFERSLFSVWTGAAPVWSVARPLHSGGCFGAEASPDRPLLSRLLFHPWLHVRFQSLSRHARNFRVASVRNWSVRPPAGGSQTAHCLR